MMGVVVNAESGDAREGVSSLGARAKARAARPVRSGRSAAKGASEVTCAATTTRIANPPEAAASQARRGKNKKAQAAAGRNCSAETGSALHRALGLAPARGKKNDGRREREREREEARQHLPYLADGRSRLEGSLVSRKEENQVSRCQDVGRGRTVMARRER